MKPDISLKNTTPQTKTINNIYEVDIDCTGVIPGSIKDLEEISAFIKKEKEQKMNLTQLPIKNLKIRKAK